MFDSVGEKIQKLSIEFAVLTIVALCFIAIIAAMIGAFLGGLVLLLIGFLVVPLYYIPYAIGGILIQKEEMLYKLKSHKNLNNSIK